MKKTVSLLLLLYSFIAVQAQHPFRGSFLMSFDPAVQHAALLVNIDTGKMAVDMMDDVQKHGVSKHVIFDSVDSAWITTMQFNDMKEATRMKATKMFRDTVIHQKIAVKKYPARRIIAGYHCHKIIAESDTCIAEVWITDDIRCDLGHLYKMFSHCGLLTYFIGKGDWFLVKDIKGMVMEVVSRSKTTSYSYTMKVSDVNPGMINAALFDLKGFKISDIREGENCGPVTVKGK